MSHKPVIVKDSFLNKSIFKTIKCSHYSKEKEIFVEYMYLSKYVSSISQCTLIRKIGTTYVILTDSSSRILGNSITLFQKNL